MLDGNGEIETIVGWEADEEDEEDEEDEDSLASRISIIDAVSDDDEDADVITSILSWNEGGVLEIVVDLGLSDEGIYLQINEIEIRPEREALEQGLIVAFKMSWGFKTQAVKLNILVEPDRLNARLSKGCKVANLMTDRMLFCL